MGVEIKLCETCINRCGINKQDVRIEVEVSSIDVLADWIAESDKVVSV